MRLLQAAGIGSLTDQFTESSRQARLEQGDGSRADSGSENGRPEEGSEDDAFGGGATGEEPQEESDDWAERLEEELRGGVR